MSWQIALHEQLKLVKYQKSMGKLRSKTMKPQMGNIKVVAQTVVLFHKFSNIKKQDHMWWS